MSKTVTILAAAALFSSANAGLTLVAETTWDSGTFEGWIVDDFGMTGGGEWINPGADGNPGGYLQYIDGPDPAITPPALNAPAEFLGDYTQYIGGVIEYDFRLSPDNPGPATGYPRLSLVGADGSVARVAADFISTTDWQTISIGINEAEWDVTVGTWDGLIQNVVKITTGGDHVIGQGPESGIDNFRLFIPAPGAVSLLALGGIAVARRRRR